MILVSEDSIVFAQKGWFYPKQHYQSQLKAFQWHFWPKSKIKKCVYKKLLNRNFCATAELDIYIKDLKKALTQYKRSRYWSLKETGMSHKQKFVNADNPGQNTCSQ